MAFSPKNLVTKDFILKFVELVMTFIVLLLFRCGNSGDPLPWSVIFETDPFLFGTMVYTGYFFIVLVMIIGIVLGDKALLTNLLFSVFGFIFYIAIGSLQIDHFRQFRGIVDVVSKNLAAGSLSILTSFVFLVDAGFNAMALRNAQ